MAWVPPSEQMCDQSEELIAVQYTQKINTGCTGMKNALKLGITFQIE